MSVAGGNSGHVLEIPPLPLWTGCVEKLENRAAPKISQMQRIDDFSRCNAL